MQPVNNDIPQVISKIKQYTVLRAYTSQEGLRWLLLTVHSYFSPVDVRRDLRGTKSHAGKT